MGDDQDITLLALQAQMGLNNIYQQKLPNRIDPRQLLRGNGYPQPNYPPQGYPQYNPPMPQQYGNTGVDDYGIPSEVPAQAPQLPLVMRQADGSMVDLTQAPSIEGQIPSQTGIGNVQSFQMPDYSKYNNATPNTEVSESSLEVILKEIKSLKKAINKLIRESEKSKLLSVPPTVCEPNDHQINDTNS